MEEDDDAQEDALNAGAKARIIVSRLIKTGWVDKEFLDNSFIEIVSPANTPFPCSRCSANWATQWTPPP